MNTKKIAIKITEILNAWKGIFINIHSVLFSLLKIYMLF